MNSRIAVAATAPFGADILERLAAEHEIALLLTRPDKPRGRGRKLAPTPAKETAERLGIPVAQPAKLDESVEIPADTIVVAAYGLLIPDALLDRGLWLNVHPSLLPRWRGRGAGRARVDGRRRPHGRDDPSHDARARRGPDRGAGGVRHRPRRRRGAVYARSAEIAARLIGDVLPEPASSRSRRTARRTPRRSPPRIATST